MQVAPNPVPVGGTSRRSAASRAQNRAADRADSDAFLLDIGHRLASGRIDAIEDCYATLGPLVAAYLGRLVARCDVDDVIQRVFFEVWRCRGRYDPARPLRAWVLDIARKRAIDHLRKRRDTVVPSEVLHSIAGADGRHDLDRFAAADELRVALDRLPPSQREALLLAYYDGYTQQEIAGLLEVPLGTVKTRTARGLRNLATLIDPRHAS